MIDCPLSHHPYHISIRSFSSRHLQQRYRCLRLPAEPLPHGPGELAGVQRRVERQAAGRGHAGAGLDLPRSQLLTSLILYLPSVVDFVYK